MVYLFDKSKTVYEGPFASRSLSDCVNYIGKYIIFDVEPEYASASLKPKSDLSSVPSCVPYRASEHFLAFKLLYLFAKKLCALGERSPVLLPVNKPPANTTIPSAAEWGKESCGIP